MDHASPPPSPTGPDMNAKQDASEDSANSAPAGAGVSSAQRCCGKGWIVSATVALIGIALATMALPLVWKAPDASKVTPLTDFIGMLHPMVLHLPIGIVMLVATVEVIGWLSFGRYKPQTLLALAICFGSTLFALVCGYMLFMSGEYGEASLDRDIGRHLWGTIAFTVVLSAALAAKIWNSYDGRHSTLYAALLMASVGTLTVGAHQGAVITHGTEPLDALIALLNPKTQTGEDQNNANVSDATVSSPQQALAYEEVVVPVLRKYCYECHSKGDENPVHAGGKVKGKLEMTSIEALEKGGSSDLPSLVAGDVENSFMLELMRYPIDDDEHMPPEDSPQPSEAEIALLEWWVAAGAPTDTPMADIPGADAHLDTVRALHENTGDTGE